jgi:hypothetical protein
VAAALRRLNSGLQPSSDPLERLIFRYRLKRLEGEA